MIKSNLPDGFMETNWEMIMELAAKAGAKFPEVVGVQWALESGYGRHLSGRNNYFGLKAEEGQDSEVLSTLEQDANGVASPENAAFLNFDSVEECVNYLVRLWYHDYEDYKGVNRAKTPEECIRLLQKENYATDKKYAEKLLKIYREKFGASKPVEAATVKTSVLYTMEAMQDTWLKKDIKQADELEDNEKIFVPKGRRYGVVRESEVPENSHFRVLLAAGSGEWFVYGPHVSKKQESIIVTGGIDWNNFNCKVSASFTVGEVLQFDTRRRPKTNSSDTARLERSIAQLQLIRTAWNRPIGVTSFYRPEPINSEVGGVSNSQHITGLAFDIYPVNDSLDRFYKWLFPRWTGGLGDGRNRGFVHVDLRNKGHFVPGAGVSPAYQWPY